MTKRIEIAERHYQQSAEHLMETIRDEYPVGTIVNVTIGNATFDAEITRHSSSWWNEPTEIYGRNLNTGKERRFWPMCINR